AICECRRVLEQYIPGINVIRTALDPSLFYRQSNAGDVDASEHRGIAVKLCDACRVRIDDGRAVSGPRFKEWRFEPRNLHSGDRDILAPKVVQLYARLCRHIRQLELLRRQVPDLSVAERCVGRLYVIHGDIRYALAMADIDLAALYAADREIFGREFFCSCGIRTDRYVAVLVADAEISCMQIVELRVADGKTLGASVNRRSL